MRKIIALLLCAVLAVGCLAGCVIENEAEHIPTGNGLYSEEETTPAATTAPEESEEKTQIVMAYYAELTLNPYACTDYTNRAFFPLLYQSLFVTDQDYNVSPLLCESYVMSEDMKNYTFYVTSDARFSDGDPVTGEDVTASLLTAMSSGYYAGRFSHVKSISNTGDGGVLIQLDTAYENLPLILDIPIVKKEQVSNTAPLGSGPYVLRTVGGSAALHKNTNWWCKAVLPIDQQIIPLSPVEGTDGTVNIRDQFEFFDVSLVLADPGSAFYAEYRCDYELWEIESGYMMYIGCNILYSEHFDDGTLRTFLTYGIDRDYLAQDAYKGMVDPVTLPCAPTEVFYNKTLAANYGYDPMKFIDYLSRYRIPLKDGTQKKMVLLVNSDDSARVRIARNIAENLTDLGLPTGTLECKGSNFKNVLVAGTYDIYLGMTRMSANMDLTEFFRPYGEMSRGGLQHETIYSMCLNALENNGNYYNLYQKLVQDGRIIPVMFGHYNVYAERGLMPDLEPARDNVFYYSLGKTMEGTLVEETYE